MALNAQILVSILAHETSNDGLGQTVRATPASYARSLTDGTGANQSQVVWSQEIPLEENGEYNVGAAVQDDRGNVLLSAVKLIYVANTGPLPVRLAGADWADCPWGTGTNIIPAGGVYLATNTSANGWTPDEFSISNSSTSATAACQIVLIGEGTVT